MDETPREAEIRKREIAQANAGEIKVGSGIRGKGKRMPQMVSARLDPELVSDLRRIARARGVTMSDLLREGAELVVAGHTSAAAIASLHTVQVSGLGTLQDVYFNRRTRAAV